MFQPKRFPIVKLVIKDVSLGQYEGSAGKDLSLTRETHMLEGSNQL